MCLLDVVCPHPAFAPARITAASATNLHVSPLLAPIIRRIPIIRTVRTPFSRLCPTSSILDPHKSPRAILKLEWRASITVSCGNKPSRLLLESPPRPSIVWGAIAAATAAAIPARGKAPSSMTSHKTTHEPRWPAFVALLADGVLCLALPKSLSVGPRWFLLAVVFALTVPMFIAHHQGHFNVNRILTLIANSIITLGLICSLCFLIEGLPKHRESPETLLRSACALWIANVLVFALWYWRLDAGGPLERDRAVGLIKSNFLFPQMMMAAQETADPHIKSRYAGWSPQFLDYLYLAFNTSTAFSPTDTAVLTRGAKVAMMLQSLISLTIIALLAARAVGIL